MNPTPVPTATVAIVAASSGSAFAREATPDATWINQARSVASRQAVHDEAVQALAAGKIAYGQAWSGVEATFVPTLSRAQVAAEARQAVRLGLTTGGEAQARRLGTQKL